MGLGILPPPGVAPAKAPLVQDFVSSGTWTKPEGARVLFIEAIGGGNSGPSSAGDGGYGGRYASITIDATAVTGPLTVAVGKGGSGAAGGFNPGAVSTVAAGPTVLLSTSTPGVNWTAATDGGRGGTPSNPGDAGGVLADEFGILKAGDGGAGGSAGVQGTKGSAPGGGGGSSVSGMLGGDGADGAIRITAFFE